MFYLDAQTPDKINQMLSRMGYEPVEYNMIKEL